MSNHDPWMEPARIGPCQNCGDYCRPGACPVENALAALVPASPPASEGATLMTASFQLRLVDRDGKFVQQFRLNDVGMVGDWRDVIGLTETLCSSADRDRRIAQLEQDVANEQHDIEMICHEVSRVYDHITGGRCGKPNTMAFEVTAEADAHYQRWADEQEREAREEMTVEIEAEKAARETAERERDQARQATLKYGRHTSRCTATEKAARRGGVEAANDPACDCGLREALGEAPAKADEAKEG